MQNYLDPDALECGTDEAGRGSIMGRIYAGACIWPRDLQSPLVKDSKKFKNREEREKAYQYVVDNAIAYSYAFCEPKEIDSIGIGKANVLAMHRAIEGLDICVDHILVDGVVFAPFMDDFDSFPSYTTVVEGDSKYYSIAAASILAKVEHDRYIFDLISKHPELSVYKLASNMGYGTVEHIAAVKTYGVSPFHRLSFKCNK